MAETPLRGDVEAFRDDNEMSDLRSEREGAPRYSLGGVSSDEEDDPNGTDHADGNEKSHNPFKRAQNFKKHQGQLNKHNRGLMQWKVPRTAQWAVNKVSNTESKVEGLFKHHTRQAGVETEV